MTKPKVLISDKMDPNAARIFTEMGCDVDVITGRNPRTADPPASANMMALPSVPRPG